MKKMLLLLTFSFVLQFSFAAELVIDGRYQGYNMFVENPMCKTEPVSFCVEKVSVNGIEIQHEQASAFEIRFDSLDFVIGDSLHIVITHQDNCKPKILNPPLSRLSKYRLESIEINDEGILTWTTTNEQGKLPYVVQQYRWNKWVTLGEVDGLGSLTENNYEYKIVPHSGKNIIRVCQIDHLGRTRPSPEVIFVSTSEEVEITVNYSDKQILCSAETLYELYDDRGNMVMRGFGNKIDCSTIKSGIYYLNFDNKNVKIVFKKTKSKK